MTKYTPALRFAWLTPVYDPVLRRMLSRIALKQRLIARTQIAAGQHVRLRPLQHDAAPPGHRGQGACAARGVAGLAARR